MSIESVVLATDFSAPSRAALERAVAVAVRAGARLYILHAVDSEAAAAFSVAAIPEAEIERVFELASELARAEALRQAAGGSATIVECVRIGRPRDEVPAFASEKNADLMVVGTRRRARLGRLLEGSVAEAIVRRAPCPVLVVHELEPRDPVEPLFARALAALDFSPSSRAALAAAADLVRPDGGTIDVVHVVDDTLVISAERMVASDPTDVTQLIDDVTRTNVRRHMQEVLGDSGSARAVIQVGRPNSVLGALAASGTYDLIACGTHGRSGLSRALFGSVAEELVRGAGCPVLVVREGSPAARRAA